MGSSRNLGRIFDKVISFFKKPVTEMVFAAILELSRNYIFTLIQPYTEGQMIYIPFQYFITVLPWIMLGHGAIRFPQKQNISRQEF